MFWGRYINILSSESETFYCVRMRKLQSNFWNINTLIKLWKLVIESEINLHSLIIFCYFCSLKLNIVFSFNIVKAGHIGGQHQAISLVMTFFSLANIIFPEQCIVLA